MNSVNVVTAVVNLSLAMWFIAFSFFDWNISFDLEDYFKEEMIKRHEIWWTAKLNQAIEQCLWASNFVKKCSQRKKDRSLNLLQKEVNKPRTNSTCENNFKMSENKITLCKHSLELARKYRKGGKLSRSFAHYLGNVSSKLRFSH